VIAKQTKKEKMNLFEVIAETNRRKMIDFLRMGPKTVGEIVAYSQLSQPGVSKHLKILREAGLVTITKESQKRLYHIQGQPLEEIDHWLEPYRKYWSEKLDALEQFLNEEESFMLAVIEKVEGGYIARYDRPLKHSVEKVWAALTQNEKLGKWMPNLHVEDLRSGGTIKFNMNDGTGASFDIKIRECKENEVLEYDWGDGWVRFEFSPKPEGCLLVLKEFIPTLNDHTSKDLAGWHVCLDVLADLLRGHDHKEFPRGNWEKWHKEYVTSVNQAKE
jgi:uncharacterized protein YndB with AHSA1/START domain